jgi:hypothetical protein
MKIARVRAPNHEAQGRSVGRGKYIEQPEIGAFLEALHGC